jgi:predicted MFS family arabinose efflux permease
VRGNQAGWGGPEILLTLAGGVLLAIAFVAWEPRARAPRLPMRLFGSRAFSAGNTSIFFFNAALTGAIFFTAQFHQVAGGVGPLEAGLRLLPWGIAPFLIAPRAGALADRFGERPLIVTGMLLMTAGMGWLALTAGPDVRYVTTIAPMTLGQSASRWPHRPSRSPS